MAKYTIYALVEPDTGAVRYIGQTTQLDYRLYQHLYGRVNPGSAVHSWISSLFERGLAPTWKILEEVDSLPRQREQYWIGIFKAQGCQLLNSPNERPASVKEQISKTLLSQKRRMSEANKQAMTEGRRRSQTWRDSVRCNGRRK